MEQTWTSRKNWKNKNVTKMDVFWEIGGNFQKNMSSWSKKDHWNISQKILLWIWQGWDPKIINPNLLLFYIYNWHSLWKLPSSNLASSLQSRLIISLPLSNDENFTLNLARHLLTYILSSGLEQEQCSGTKSFLKLN